MDRHRLRFQSLVLISVLCVLGLFLIYKIVQQTVQVLEDELLLQARLVASSFDINDIKALNGSDDYSSYEHIYSHLLSITKENPNYRSVYLMKLNDDGLVYFAAEYSPDPADDTVPGTLYDEATSELRASFRNSKPFIEYQQDIWGNWVSAIVPIRDYDAIDLEVVAIFGIDYEHSDWIRVIIDRVFFPCIMLILMCLLVVLYVRIINNRNDILKRAERIKRQKDALSKFTIADDVQISSFGYDKVFQRFMQMVAETLVIDRVAIWFLSVDGKTYSCQTMFDINQKLFTKDMSVEIAKYPQFFEYMHHQNIISLNNVSNEPLFVDFYRTALNGMNVKSMLNCNIRENGEVIGVLSVETYTDYRFWEVDEEAFVEIVSAMISQTLAREKRDNAERELAASKQRFEDTLESMTDGFIYFDRDKNLQFINNNAFSILNLDYGRLQYTSIWELLEGDLASLFMELITESLANNQEFDRTEFVRSIEKWIEFRVFPTNNDVSLFFSDITKKKQTEKAIMENQRLTAIGEMASAFSHDFNNYLQVILANIEVLDQKLATLSDVRDYLKIIHTTTNDAATRVQLLQRFSGTKNSQTKYDRINLNDVVSEAVIQAIPIWKTEPEHQGIDIKLNELYQPTSDILGNEDELRSVLYNLIKNAVEAMPATIDLPVRVIDIETGQNENGVFLRVSDTGCGMTDDVAQRVFEPFFTTKGYDSGKGLGLSGVYNIVHEHGGIISLVSTALNQGSTFEILFPHRDFVEDKNAEKPSTVHRHQVPSVLWVDDDPLIRQIGFDMLEMMGYDVHIAENGESALEILASHDIDILLSDIGMPGMNGWQLMDKAQDLYPNKMKRVLISGWGDQIPDSQRVEHNIDHILGKPVKMAQVKQLLEDMWK